MGDKINIKGVINIGAHHGKQYNEWIKAGAKSFLFIEPIAESFAELVKEFSSNHSVRLIKTALGTYKGKAVMYNDDKHLSFSASILKPTGHLEDYPEIEFHKKEEVDIDTLDGLDYDRSLYDHIYITAQGMEMEILKHGQESLKHIQTIKSQVYRKRLYEGCCLADEFTEFLCGTGFELIDIELAGISWDYATYQR